MQALHCIVQQANNLKLINHSLTTFFLSFFGFYFIFYFPKREGGIVIVTILDQEPTLLVCIKLWPLKSIKFREILNQLHLKSLKEPRNHIEEGNIPT